MVNFRRYLILFCLPAGLFSLQAQSASHGTARSSSGSPDIQFQFSVFARSELSGLSYMPRAGKQVKPLHFYASSRSASYNYQGQSQIAFYEPSNPAMFDPKTGVPKPVAFYTVPEGMQRALLLFFPKPAISSDGLKYEIYGLDDGVDKIPAGHFVIVNASLASYAGAVGSGIVSVPRGVTGPFPGRDDTQIRLWREDRPNSPPVIQERWTLKDRQRMIMVLFPPHSPTGRSPIIRRLDDTLPQEQSQKGYLATNWR